MNVGIYTFFGFKYNFDQIMKLIKNAGFHSVMTYWGDEFDNTETKKEKQPEIIRKNGLELENTHLPFDGINNIWEDTLNGQEILEMYLSYIDKCKQYEIPTAIVHVSSGNNPPPYNQLGLDRFKKIVEKAEKNGITIALENLRKPEYLDFVYNNIESDKLMFCYDSGHENCYTPNIDYLRKYGNKLIALHLHDNDGTDDQHLSPFKGSIDWKHKMEHLRNLEYNKPLSLEIDSQFIKEFDEFKISDYLSEVMNIAIKLMEL
jgi:sugar phosphate isomerase/epimerase